MSTPAKEGYTYCGQEGWHYVDREAEDEEESELPPRRFPRGMGPKRYITRCALNVVSDLEPVMHSYPAVCPDCAAVDSVEEFKPILAERKRIEKEARDAEDALLITEREEKKAAKKRGRSGTS